MPEPLTEQDRADIQRAPWFSALRARVRYVFRSEWACASCGRWERPWRRMMAYPYGRAGFASICSDRCWDAMDARRRATHSQAGPK